MPVLQRRPFLVWMIAVAAACADRPSITAPADAGWNPVSAAAKPLPPSVVEVEPATDEFTIDGTVQDVEVTVTNPGKNANNMWIALRIVQPGGVYRDLGSAAVSCDGQALGALPSGATCSVILPTAVASAGPGAGVLAPGQATLEADLLQMTGKGKVVSTAGVDVTLVEPPPPAPPAITALSLASSVFVIEGAGVPYTVTISNPTGSPITGVILQAEIRQGTETQKGAGGALVFCTGQLDGVFPPGDCTLTWSASASNTSGGGGVLTDGPAFLDVHLIEEHTILDTWTVNITLQTTAYFESVVLASSTFDLSGGAVSATIRLQNPTGIVFDPVQVAGTIRQGTAHRIAGIDEVQCSGYPHGTLGHGECEFTMSFVADNGNGGDGFLNGGAATLELVLRNTNSIILDTAFVPIQITAGSP